MAMRIAGYVAVVTLLCAGCASTRIRHINAEDFIASAKVIEEPNTLLYVSCVGVSHDRAYLECQDYLTLSGKPVTTVLWTRLRDLPAELADKLRAGNPPWTPWQNKTKKDKKTTGITVPVEGAARPSPRVEAHRVTMAYPGVPTPRTPRDQIEITVSGLSQQPAPLSVPQGTTFYSLFQTVRPDLIGPHDPLTFCRIALTRTLADGQIKTWQTSDSEIRGDKGTLISRMETRSTSVE